MAAVTTDTPAESQGVRFASENQEIAPATDLTAVKTLTGVAKEKSETEGLDPAAQKELQQLRTTLQNNIQSARAQHHAFEPVSLPGSQPVSRVRYPFDMQYA